MAQRLYLVNTRDRQYLALCDDQVPHSHVEDRIEDLLGDDQTIRQLVLLQPTTADSAVTLFGMRAVVRFDKPA